MATSLQRQFLGVSLWSLFGNVIEALCMFFGAGERGHYERVFFAGGISSRTELKVTDLR